MTTVNAHKQLASSLRSGTPSDSRGKDSGAGRSSQNVSHLKQLHEAATKKLDAINQKKEKKKREMMTSDELIEYRMRSASEEDVRQIAFMAHNQMETLHFTKRRVDEAMTNCAPLFEEEEIDTTVDPDAALKGREWVQKSRRKVNGQLFRYNESCNEREEQLGDFCEWFELYENMWPLPLVTNHVQFEELQGINRVDDMEDHINEMEKIWPKMGMMRDDLTKLMGQTAEMGRKALNAELKSQIESLTRKLNKSEELVESLQRSLDAEKNTTRELRNEASKAKMIAEAQMARKVEELKLLEEKMAKMHEANKKQIEEINEGNKLRENKLREQIKQIQAGHKAEVEGLKTAISDLAATNTSITEENLRLKGIVAEKEDHITRLQETIRNLEDRLEVAKKELVKAIEDLRIEKEESKTREAKFLKAIEEQKFLIKRKDDEIKEKNKIIEDMKLQIQALQEEIVQLKVMIKELEEQIEVLKKKLSDAIKKVDEQARQIKVISEACEKLKKEIKAKENELKTLQDAASKYVNQINELREKLLNTEEMLAGAKEDLAQNIAAHEKDTEKWAEDRRGLEEQKQRIQEENDSLCLDLEKKDDEFHQLGVSKQTMMDEYERNISELTISYEKTIAEHLQHISKIENEVSELQAFKAKIDAKRYAEVSTEIENSWFLENASGSKSKPGTPGNAAPQYAQGGSFGGGLSADQASRVLTRFRTLREKLYFMRIGFERDSAEFRSGVKETLENKAEVQKELDLDVKLLREKVDKMIEIAQTGRVAVTEMDDKDSNRMVLDLCDESVCLLEHLGSSRESEPSRLACELILDVDVDEMDTIVGIEGDLKREILENVAHSCGIHVGQVKVRSLRTGGQYSAAVIADLILCQGGQGNGKSTMALFQILKEQAANPESLLRQCKATCKASEARLKKKYSVSEPKKSSNLKLLQGVPQTMLDLEQILEGIEGALADPVTMANDPTTYAPHQARPSSSVVAQLRPLLAVARMKQGTDLAESIYDFSQISLLSNKHKKSQHQAQHNFFDDVTTTSVPPDGTRGGAEGHEGDWRGDSVGGNGGRNSLGNMSPSTSPASALTSGTFRRLSEPGRLGHSHVLMGLSNNHSDPLSFSTLMAAKSRGILQQQNGSFNGLQEIAEIKATSMTMMGGKVMGMGGSAYSAPAPMVGGKVMGMGGSAYSAPAPMVGGKVMGMGGSAYSAPAPMVGGKVMGMGGSAYSAPAPMVGGEVMGMGGSAYSGYGKAGGAGGSRIQVGGDILTFDKALNVSEQVGTTNPLAKKQSLEQQETFLQRRFQQVRDDSHHPYEKGNPRSPENDYSQPFNKHPGLRQVRTSHVDPDDSVPELLRVEGRSRRGLNYNVDEMLENVLRSKTASQKEAAQIGQLVSTSKPVSKPLTVSRRISPAELNALSEMNLSDQVKLPRLIETYEMQAVGLVGRSRLPDMRPTRCERPRSQPENLIVGEFEEKKGEGMYPEYRNGLEIREMRESINLRPLLVTGANPYSQPAQLGGADLQPTFAEVPSSSQDFPGKPVQTVKVKSRRDTDSPTDVEPWGADNVPPPAFRASKIIRSFDYSKDKKPRSPTMNPRLNAVELTLSSNDLRMHVLDISGELTGNQP